MNSDGTCDQRTAKQTRISDVHKCDSLKGLDALEFRHQKQEDEVNSSLSIKLPSVREFNNGVEEDDEPTTPTSSDQKIPVPITCPPAPRKPRSVPMSKKRRTPSVRRISVDLMLKFNAIFVPQAVIVVPDILAGDLDAGDGFKKVKKANVTIGSST
ncbi:hypothetical protein R6Q59_025835 [Mikania micrantha]|uniref:Uncharacterized protein n=1 Tax=Mikania micrantha TaxID=192012 RepID=A0A5N6PFD3_9ASTR|nr:hypothetical protein E3N88_11097 [Mikania micrantha]